MTNYITIILSSLLTDPNTSFLNEDGSYITYSFEDDSRTTFKATLYQNDTNIEEIRYYQQDGTLKRIVSYYEDGNTIKYKAFFREDGTPQNLTWYEEEDRTITYENIFDTSGNLEKTIMYKNGVPIK